MRSIHEGFKIPCDQCYFKATCKSSLLRHSKSTHEGLKYYCVKCAYKTSSKDNLKEHSQSKHENVEFACKRKEVLVNVDQSICG